MDEHLKNLMQSVCERASDLKLAECSTAFTEQNVGKEALKKELFEAVQKWENYIDEDYV